RQCSQVWGVPLRPPLPLPHLGDRPPPHRAAARADARLHHPRRLTPSPALPTGTTPSTAPPPPRPPRRASGPPPPPRPRARAAMRSSSDVSSAVSRIAARACSSARLTLASVSLPSAVSMVGSALASRDLNTACAAS